MQMFDLHNLQKVAFRQLCLKLAAADIKRKSYYKHLHNQVVLALFYQVVQFYQFYIISVMKESVSKNITVKAMLPKIMNEVENLTKPTSSGCSADNEFKRSSVLSLSLVIVILNFVEILMILKFKKKNEIYDIILLSLSLSDCLFGLSNVFVNIFILTGSCESETLLEGTYVFYVFTVLSSIFHLMFITMDRVKAILQPFRHKTFMTRNRIYIFLVLLWALAVAISVMLKLLEEFTEMFKQSDTVSELQDQSFTTTLHPHLFTTVDSTTSDLSQEHLTLITGKENSFQKDMELTISVIIIIADIIMITSYSLIVYTMNFKNRASGSFGELKKLPVICIAIVLTFILFTLPFATINLATGKIPFWANLILIANSGMNSIVYFFRGKLSKC